MVVGVIIIATTVTISNVSIIRAAVLVMFTASQSTSISIIIITAIELRGLFTILSAHSATK